VFSALHNTFLFLAQERSLCAFVIVDLLAVLLIFIDAIDSYILKRGKERERCTFENLYLE